MPQLYLPTPCSPTAPKPTHPSPPTHGQLAGGQATLTPSPSPMKGEGDEGQSVRPFWIPAYAGMTERKFRGHHPLCSLRGHSKDSGSVVVSPLDHRPYTRQPTYGQPGEGVESPGRRRKPLRHREVTLWRPRSPAEQPPNRHGGDLGGARVCRGAWRYAPLPQREVGNLALLRRSRNPPPRSGRRAAAFRSPASGAAASSENPPHPPLPKEGARGTARRSGCGQYPWPRRGHQARGNGNASTSSMRWAPRASISRRSTPSATPAQSGRP